MKKYGDIIFFYLFGVFGGWDAKRECATQTSAKDTLPFLFCFFLCYNQIRNDGQQDLQDHKADHNLTVGPLVFLRIAIFRKRSKNTLTRPIPPSTIITPAISRYKNGWRDCMARMAM